MTARAICLFEVFISGLAWIARAQERPATTPTSPSPPASSRPVIGNDGTPMLLPFRCSAEDVRWAGLSCSDDAPCPIFFEISSVEAVGNLLLLTGNIHGESVTLDSVLLASEDNGHTWQEPIDRIRGAGLDHVEYSGSDTAWISGQELFPLPQNPFLISTRDGGNSWRLHEILGEDSDLRFGSVQQFFFTSKDNGTLVVDHGAGAGGDRYALYETENGGETWALKQASAKPIVVKRPTPPPVSDWRVRADAALGSYVVEHRVGVRWSAVAAFLVKLEPCKPPDEGKIP